MAIVLGVVQVLVLLLPAAACLLATDLVQARVAEAGRRRGLGPGWQQALLAEEFAWTIRIVGAVLLLLGLLLAAALLTAG